MFIQTQETPNPATVKFIPGQTILESGLKDYKSVSEASGSPLAQRLFAIQGVRGVFLGPDFVSVSKADDTDWIMLKSLIMAAMMEHLSTGQPIVVEVDSGDDGADDCEIVVQIKELIETRVRPMVMMDGGDIVFDSFDDGIVYLSMRGACAGCPSSTMTLKSGIESMLKHFVPEVVEVRPVEA
ncbi:MAG: NifU family protein [Alphaproteobacteria bacterium]